MGKGKKDNISLRVYSNGVLIREERGGTAQEQFDKVDTEDRGRIIAGVEIDNPYSRIQVKKKLMKRFARVDVNVWWD